MSVLELSSSEKQDVEYLADLYACVVAIEQVEKAHRREYISSEQYQTNVERLLQKYHSTVDNLSSAKNPYFTTGENFLAEYCNKYHAAMNTIKNGPSLATDVSKRFLARQVMDCTQLFITLLDTLRLHQNSVDKLNPLLADLLVALKKINVRDRDFFQRLSSWHDRLNGMNAADVLDVENIRQLEYDLDRGYSDLRSMMDSETN